MGEVYSENRQSSHETYVTPEHAKKAFHCPHCNVYSAQHWGQVRFHGLASHEDWDAEGHLIVQCFHCSNYSFWVWVDRNIRWQMSYPLRSFAPMPNQDMPEDVISDYMEARQILSFSPRGAAALLRLAIQKLCKHLGESGENINRDIGKLVEKGLHPRIQRSLDIVRLVGNDAVHPGQIDLRDDPAMAHALFGLVNIIVDEMITRAKHINELYENLPDSKREGIEKRDGKT